MSFVYFILAESDQGSDYVKIGVAADPVARLASLQTASPLKLSLKGQIPGDASLEARLHQYFKEVHVRGEWFKLDWTVEDDFKQVMTGDVELILSQAPWTEKLHRYLTSKGVSRAEFCDDAGIKTSALARLFDGKAHATSKVQKAICEATGGAIRYRDFARAPSPLLSLAKTEAA